MPPFACQPDPYLSEGQLSALFEEFCLATLNNESDDVLFSTVVNNVRLVYMAALLKLQADMLTRCMQDGDELARLRRERSEQPPIYRTEDPATGTPDNPQTAAPAQGAGAADQASSASPGQDSEEQEIRWPAKSFPLHIGSYSADHRRDMPGWDSMDIDGWTERMQFNVFKFQEPGTIRMEVTEQFNTHRMMVNGTQGGWSHRLAFFAYNRPRPGTEYVWVAFREDPDRCLFLKGKPSDTLEGWERTLEFWVPK